MKFLHTSDWHLGRMLYGRSLLPDQQHFIREQFLPLAEREKPDAVLLAGDVYDRSVAPAGAIALFDEALTRLAELGWQVTIREDTEIPAGQILSESIRRERLLDDCGIQVLYRPLPEEKNGARRV